LLAQSPLTKELSPLNIDQLIADNETDAELRAALSDDASVEKLAHAGLTVDDTVMYARMYRERAAEDIDLSFADWLAKYFAELYNATAAETERYTQHIIASSYLQ
jgi:hypothetical protein